MRTAISRLSTEYVSVPLVTPPGVTLGAQSVALALLPVNSGALPTEGDWNAATLEGDTARLLLGPGGLALDPGRHRVFVRVVDDPETPVLPCGLITVT